MLLLVWGPHVSNQWFDKHVGNASFVPSFFLRCFIYVNISFYRWGNWGTYRLSNLPRKWRHIKVNNVLKITYLKTVELMACSGCNVYVLNHYVMLLHVELVHTWHTGYLLNENLQIINFLQICDAQFQEIIVLFQDNNLKNQGFLQCACV